MIVINKELNENSIIPLYYQIKEILKENINNGVWQPDQEIPSENEMCEIFDVSRTTVRKAIQELEKENLIYKKRGKGTFVKSSKINKDLLGELSFFKEMQSLGFSASSSLIKKDILRPSEQIQKSLNLDDFKEVLVINRLRLVDDEPFAIETTYLEFEKYQDILKKDLNTLVLYEVLKSEYNVEVDKVTVYIEPIIIADFFTDYLNVPSGTPALSIKRTVLFTDGSGVFSEMIVRGDKAKFFITTK
ncbi:GntR family transcriptional regulator [Natronincola ferrireducens]|uniref:GntR family transcriptional regulator n=1 Tax=Natronincola ferrireducens TaxID=393762 RepID=A0A1G9A6J3_9FIRM|nr:GntR family transcriptional regulator [Natronincola ferrireducens]SDK22956.1 GntR family transcriptional regulator [Natronincola ferrireducens]